MHHGVDDVACDHDQAVDVRQRHQGIDAVRHRLDHPELTQVGVVPERLRRAKALEVAHRRVEHAGGDPLPLRAPGGRHPLGESFHLASEHALREALKHLLLVPLRLGRRRRRLGPGQQHGLLAVAEQQLVGDVEPLSPRPGDIEAAVAGGARAPVVVQLQRRSPAQNEVVERGLAALRELVAPRLALPELAAQRLEPRPLSRIEPVGHLEDLPPKRPDRVRPATDRPSVTKVVHLVFEQLERQGGHVLQHRDASIRTATDRQRERLHTVVNRA